MKITKSFILLFTLLFALLLVGCANNQDTNNEDINKKEDTQNNPIDEKENEDDKEEIKVEIPDGLSMDEYNTIINDFAKEQKVSVNSVKITKFYTKLDSKYALWIDSSELGYATVMTNYKIAGVPFSFSSSQEILIYENGKFTNLKKAYDTDLITAEEVVSIYNVYRNKNVTCSVDKLIISDLNNEVLLIYEYKLDKIINETEITKLLNLQFDNSNKYKVYLDNNKTKELEETKFTKKMNVYVEVTEEILSKWDTILKKYQDDKNVNQVLLVKHTTGSNAIVEFYNKTDGEWVLVFSENGVVGSKGIGKQAEGDKKTPTGDFGIGSAFGILENPGTKLNYIRVTKTTYACDEDSPYYNTIIDTSVVNHTCHGEEMYKYTTAYAYGLQIGYNLENVYPKGSAIFLHVKSGSSTAGCVAITKDHMKTVLQMADSNMRICIDDNE